MDPNGAGQQQVIFQNVHGFVFNPVAVIAIDFTRYEAGKPGRTVVIHLAGPVSKSMIDSGGDAVYKWYVEASGGSSPLPSALMGRAPRIT